MQIIEYSEEKINIARIEHDENKNLTNKMKII